MLNEKQLICIKSLLLEGKTQKEIAKDIKVSEQTICEWKKDNEFKEELHKQMKEYFSVLAVKAQKCLNKLLDSQNEYIQLQAIKDVLDRAGYKPVEKQITGNANINYTATTYEDFIKNVKGDEF